VIAERSPPERPRRPGPLAADLGKRVDDPHELGEQEVAGGGADRVVEFDVEVAEPVCIIDGAAKLPKECVETDQQAVVGAQGGQADVTDFNRPAASSTWASATMSFEKTKSRWETSCWGSSEVM